MTFKDLRPNYPVYILDKDNMVFISGKVTANSFPRLNNGMNGKTEMVVDVTIEAANASATYTIPENSTITYTKNLVLATDRSLLINEVESMKNQAEEILASADKHKMVLEKSKDLLVQLNPIYKEKQETDQRFSKIENSLYDMRLVIKNQNKMMGQLMEKLLSKT